MDEKTERRFRKQPGLGLLWFGFLGGPTAWALQFTVAYFVTPYLCGRRWTPVLFGITAGALMLSGLSLLAAHRCWIAAGSTLRTDEASVLGRTRMMSHFGVIGGAFFCVVILVQAVPMFFLDPCR